MITGNNLATKDPPAVRGISVKKRFTVYKPAVEKDLRSDLESAVNFDDLAVDECGIIGCKEQGDGCDIFRLTDSL